MHHFVVRQRHDEMLAVLVEHGESELVVMVLAVHRILAEVEERVVHPAHVPLEGEPEPAVAHRLGHAGPRGRFFRDGETARRLQPNRLVGLLEKLDRFQVFASAILVAQPLARFAAVVEIQHRRDRVDAQAVDMELVEPIERVGNQEVADLVAAVVEDQRAPVGMLSQPRILVLVERRAVESAQRVVVAREMRRHPVENDTDVVPVHRVDEEPKIVWRAIP